MFIVVSFYVFHQLFILGIIFDMCVSIFYLCSIYVSIKFQNACVKVVIVLFISNMSLAKSIDRFCFVFPASKPKYEPALEILVLY